MNITVSFGDIIAGVALLLGIYTTWYTIKLNKKIYAPKVDFLFEEIPHYTQSGAVVYKGSRSYNLIMTNSSEYHLYNFKATCTFKGLDEKKLNERIGFLNKPLATFVRGQQYISFFENMKELSQQGCDEIIFNIEYNLHPKRRKVYHEKCVITVDALRNIRHIITDNY